MFIVGELVRYQGTLKGSPPLASSGLAQIVRINNYPSSTIYTLLLLEDVFYLHNIHSIGTPGRIFVAKNHTAVANIHELKKVNYKLK